jgi:UDP-N-acetyl-D-galactosamine dehydrogenase
LLSHAVEVFETDPQADPQEAVHDYGVELTRFDEMPRAHAIVAAVAHRECQLLTAEDQGRKLVKRCASFDVRAALDAHALSRVGRCVGRL